MNNVTGFICHSFVRTRVCIIGLWIDIVYDAQYDFDSFIEHVHCTCIKIANR
jgi:hypothetical protein